MVANFHLHLTIPVPPYSLISEVIPSWEYMCWPTLPIRGWTPTHIHLLQLPEPLDITTHEALSFLQLTDRGTNIHFHKAIESDILLDAANDILTD